MQTGRAFSSARLHVEVRTLTERWANLRASARVTAHDALGDLEAAREGAAARLERLHEEASAAGARAGRRLEELHREIDKTRVHLVEILRRLVATAESIGMPNPQPG